MLQEKNSKKSNMRNYNFANINEVINSIKNTSVSVIKKPNAIEKVI